MDYDAAVGVKQFHLFWGEFCILIKSAYDVSVAECDTVSRVRVSALPKLFNDRLPCQDGSFAVILQKTV